MLTSIRRKIKSARQQVGEKGNELVHSIASEMEKCLLPIHIRFSFCNLNDVSIALLARSLKRNTSLVGFSFLPWHKDKFRDIIIKTLAPLQTWDNNSLSEDISKFRRNLKLRALLCALQSTKSPAKCLPREIIYKIILTGIF